MKINTEPTAIWEEYQRGKSYKMAVNLYNNVEDNENFYLGNQWEGVNVQNIPKPVINFIKRSVAYFIATIISDDISVQLQPFTSDDNTEKLMRVFSRDVDRILESDKTRTKFREVLRNAAVDGDGVIYWRWDTDVKTGQAAEGDVRSDVLSNINVHFGNPYDRNVQSQPYIIIAQRVPLDLVRDEAKENGVKDVDRIVSDEDPYQREKGSGSDLVTVLTKLWKDPKTKKVHAQKSTYNLVIRKDWDTRCTMYPIAWMSWDRVQNSYHGQAAVTGIIPNQITVNKLMAMYVKSVEMNAFPKIVYDGTKIKNWTNRVGEAIKVMGAVDQTAVNVLRGGDTSSQVMEVIQTLITLTRDAVGANDAALGNINPEQASGNAIIATTQANAAPLEIQRQDYFDLVEQCVLIILDYMGAYYGTRNAAFDNDETAVDPLTGAQVQSEPIMQMVDYTQIPELVKQTNVSIGSSAYWSELAQMQTMDNLLQTGIIQDTVLYLESIPDKWLPNKQALIDSAKQMQQQQQMMMPDPMMQQPAQDFDAMLDGAL
ncbi:MAG: hypothetical protein IKK29_05565 [Christensenellaceae bacterium]|nr:hypothetical protein [Christensenellaceae bacterium]